MRVVIDIPKDFARDYATDKFRDFFIRVIADIDYSGVCGRYEEETAEMFLKAFNDSFVDVLGGGLNENYSRKSRAVLPT